VRVVCGPHAGAEGVVTQVFRIGPGRLTPRAMIETEAGALHSIETGDMKKIEGART
jgi:hypothetical protein